MIEDFIVCEDGVTRRWKIQAGKKDRKWFLRGYIPGLVTDLENKGRQFFSFTFSL